MKYYRLFQFSSVNGKYCGHRCVKTNNDINDILNKYESYIEITKEDYYSESGFYRITY